VQKDEAMESMRKREIESLEKTAATSLERTLANIVVITGVCIASGLAPCTSISIPSSDTETTVQIGSYSLLAALGTGFTALLGSITSLANAADSAKKLLRFQEHTLSALRTYSANNSAGSWHETRDFEENGLDFSDGSIRDSTRITTWSLLRWSRESFLLPFSAQLSCYCRSVAENFEHIRF
jgi:hypothetical protein